MKYIFFLLALFLSTGCSKPWNTAHTALEAVAEATNATDRIARSQMPGSYDEMEAAILLRATTDDPPQSREYYLELAETHVRGWINLYMAIEAMRDTLLNAEDVLILWRRLGSANAPREWNAICESVGSIQDRITVSLEAVDVEIPVLWDTIRPLLEPLCTFAVDLVEAEQ